MYVDRMLSPPTVTMTRFLRGNRSRVKTRMRTLSRANLRDDKRHHAVGMRYKHRGHVSLLELARKQCSDVTA